MSDTSKFSPSACLSHMVPAVLLCATAHLPEDQQKSERFRLVLKEQHTRILKLLERHKRERSSLMEIKRLALLESQVSLRLSNISQGERQCDGANQQ